VLEAADSAIALELGRHFPGFINLLITRINMHGLSGPELGIELKRRHPGMHVLYISDGRSSFLREADAFVLSGALESAESFLVKPFTEGILLEKTGDLLRDSEP
jgi:hypothetical protein